MKKDNNCFYKETQLNFYDCDYKKRARLETIMQYMSDIGGLSYASKGYTYDWLCENNFAFLLSKASIHIKRPPLSSESLTIETWERKLEGMLFYRDVAFYDKDSNPIIECTTGWVLANPHTHSIIRPSMYTGEINPHPTKVANCLPITRIKPASEPELCGTRKIVYSDIDANNHVYNAVYGGIACDFLPETFIEKDISDFRINFKHEALLNQEIVVKTAFERNVAWVIGEVQGKISFEAEFVFA